MCSYPVINGDTDEVVEQSKTILLDGRLVIRLDIDTRQFLAYLKPKIYDSSDMAETHLQQIVVYQPMSSSYFTAICPVFAVKVILDEYVDKAVSVTQLSPTF